MLARRGTFNQVWDQARYEEAPAALSGLFPPRPSQQHRSQIQTMPARQFAQVPSSPPPSLAVNRTRTSLDPAPRDAPPTHVRPASPVHEPRRSFALKTPNEKPVKRDVRIREVLGKGLRKRPLPKSTIDPAIDPTQVVREREAFAELKDDLKGRLSYDSASPREQHPDKDMPFAPQVPYMDNTEYAMPEYTPMWKTDRPTPTPLQFIQHYLPSREKFHRGRALWKEYTKSIFDVLDPKYKRRLKPFRLSTLLALGVLSVVGLYLFELYLLGQTELEEMFEISGKNYVRSSSFVVAANTIQRMVNDGLLEPMLSTPEAQAVLNESINLAHFYNARALQDLSYLISGFTRAIEHVYPSSQVQVDHFSQTEVDISFIPIDRYLHSFERFLDVLYTRNTYLVDSATYLPYGTELGGRRQNFLSHLKNTFYDVFSPIGDFWKQFTDYFDLTPPPVSPSTMPTSPDKVDLAIQHGKLNEINLSSTITKRFSTDLAKISDLYHSDLPRVFRYISPETEKNHQPSADFYISTRKSLDADFKNRYLGQDNTLPAYLDMFRLAHRDSNAYQEHRQLEFDYAGFNRYFSLYVKDDYRDYVERELEMLLHLRKVFTKLATNNNMELADIPEHRTTTAVLLQQAPYLEPYFNIAKRQLSTLASNNDEIPLIPRIFQYNQYEDRAQHALNEMITAREKFQMESIKRRRFYETFLQNQDQSTPRDSIEYGAQQMLLDPNTGKQAPILELDTIRNRFEEGNETQEKIGSVVTKLDMCILLLHAELDRQDAIQSGIQGVSRRSWL